MSPRKGTGYSGNGGGRELQALLDSAIVEIADKDDAAGQIPWRTSRRLQEATLRSLVKEREFDDPVLVKKEKASPEALCVGTLKRQRSPSSPTTPLEFCRTEETDDGESHGESSVDEDSPRKGSIVCKELGYLKRKKRMVHFANPLVYYIEDKTQGECLSKPLAEQKSVQRAENDDRGSPKEGAATRHQPKLPMSCFDLLCSYSGAKGWRCYRSCIEGESYCCFHLSSRKAASPPVVRFPVCS